MIAAGIRTRPAGGQPDHRKSACDSSIVPGRHGVRGGAASLARSSTSTLAHHRRSWTRRRAAWRSRQKLVGPEGGERSRAPVEMFCFGSGPAGPRPAAKAQTRAVQPLLFFFFFFRPSWEASIEAAASSGWRDSRLTWLIGRLPERRGPSRILHRLVQDRRIPVVREQGPSGPS